MKPSKVQRFLIIDMKTTLTECQGCGCKNAPVTYVSKYKGYRGTCPSCGTNWPES